MYSSKIEFRSLGNLALLKLVQQWPWPHPLGGDDLGLPNQEDPGGLHDYILTSLAGHSENHGLGIRDGKIELVRHTFCHVVVEAP